ncbi:MAG TPA: 5-amino-6-(D-ribitylamino)uracil--L-tyrosine 4-hydroxyphenyl transferase CofH, partial [Methanocorpusculum sp.]|nr:5-amino-6-(D-ribitylamino)uracil--L-tyrosine 4-hydroxyphenyl transferase CofH [Methanocorpusculum sp.]
SGSRMTESEAVYLLNTTNYRDVCDILIAADSKRHEVVGDDVTYVRNMNVHLTNICKNRCGLCAFGRSPTNSDAYCLSEQEIRDVTRKARDKHVTEICYLSGINPEFTIDTYENIIRIFHEELPGIHVHGCSPDEIEYMSSRNHMSTKQVLFRLKEAGLGSVQGTAAEILVDSIRNVICKNKISTDQWVNIIREAYEVGFKASSTIMYGSIESSIERVKHLSILRDLQDETNVFTELVPLSFLHRNTPLEFQGLVTHGPTAREDLLLIAVSRLFLDNIVNIQVPWSKIGHKLTQIGLMSGGNDVGGTMYVDMLSVSAGANSCESNYFDPIDMQNMCTDIGRSLKCRDTLYNILDN